LLQTINLDLTNTQQVYSYTYSCSRSGHCSWRWSCQPNVVMASAAADGLDVLHTADVVDVCIGDVSVAPRLLVTETTLHYSINTSPDLA